ncbi:MAG: TetR family transcriptional regulator [Alphaproteobacteria bacterium]|nr:TetR family transcriptional regulator [Alphaproteobacteria bacterium]MBU0795434.1 TetR family transcriptional regulator [Alphaproteobacteria bacterium]MBU0876611.1 TetR family transcriptional regulator [Alphaproteobacteria bacterium]MBU1769312.1 TetR family transcriptional regulator [Alphaproteobacteria bacterium]
MRQRDAQATKARIFRAATREFGAHGYAGARIEKIVSRAGCSIRMIYHHYGSKAALYRAVVEGAYRDLREQEAALGFDLDDPMGCLERLLRFTMRYFAEHPDFEGIIRSENDLRGRVVGTSHAIENSGAALKARLAQIIAAGEAKGLFRPGIDPLKLYVTITALSRFHLANGHSLSAILGADLRAETWRADWTEWAADLLRRQVSRSTVSP